MSSSTPGAHPGDPTVDRARKRTLFRVLGILFMGTALVLIGISIYDVFTSGPDLSGPDMSSPNPGELGFGEWDMEPETAVDEPDKFWMFFVALPFFVAGGFLLNLGFSGAAARYMADEYSPAIQRVSRDLGLREDAAPAPGSGPFCRSCGRQNDADARFCDGCGTSMSA
jgi:hypothetical protein